MLGPEVVVVGEAGLRAGPQVLLAALERLAQLEQALLLLAGVLVERLVDLGAQLVEVGGARLLVDPRHDRGGEVEDLLELLGSHVEQVADPRRDALEEPDVAHGGGQVDVAHALAAHLGARDLHAAALADDALVADALVLAAVALPVLGRTEDALAEQAVLLGLQGAVVDRLGLGDLTGAPAPDLLRGRQPDLDRVEIVDVDQCSSLLLVGAQDLADRASSSSSMYSASVATSSVMPASPSSTSSSSDSSAASSSPPPSARARPRGRCRAPRRRAAGRRPRRPSRRACPPRRPR